jgi:voltage-gated potassium channel
MIKPLSAPASRSQASPAWHRGLYWIYQGTLAGLALTVVWLFTLPDEAWITQANVAIWAVFFLDYVIRLAYATDRRQFVLKNVPDLVAALPVDLLLGQDIFGLGRLARLVLIFRLLRAVSVLWRVSRSVRDILQTNQLGYVMLFISGLVVVGGIGIWLVEPEIGSIGDGVWWSLVTAATVGYGDIAPKTLPGRIVAAVMMIIGISTFGLVTSTVTTYFLQQQKPANPHLAAIVVQLQHWESLTSAERHQAACLLKSLAEANDSVPVSDNQATRAES